MRRAVPLLRSDYQSSEGKLSYATGNQGHTFGISSWFPYYGQGVYQTALYMPYYVRSHMGPCFGIGANIRKPGTNWDEYRLLVSQWREAVDYMLGDYYPLTQYSLQLDQWIAWQFNRPEQNDGMIQVFRRDNCNESTKTFILSALDPTVQYEVINFDSPGSMKISGRELMEKGLTVEIKDKPGAVIIKYKLLK